MAFDVGTAPVRYERLRAQITPQLYELTGQQAVVPVAACPGWSVTDVMAHVSGLVAETLAGVPLPRGSDEATARQVQDRRGLSLVEICDEWYSNADAFSAYGQEDPAYVAALTSDLVIHGGDIAEALTIDLALDEDTVAKVAERYGETLQERAHDLAGIALTLAFEHGVTLDPPGGGQIPLSLRASAHDFLRAVTGRRLRKQVCALDWSDNPNFLLDHGWSQYSPLQD